MGSSEDALIPPIAEAPRPGVGYWHAGRVACLRCAPAHVTLPDWEPIRAQPEPMHDLVRWHCGSTVVVALPAASPSGASALGRNQGVTHDLACLRARAARCRTAVRSAAMRDGSALARTCAPVLRTCLIQRPSTIGAVSSASIQCCRLCRSMRTGAGL